MPPSAHKFRSISTTVLRRITALALACLILVAGTQLWLERQHQKTQFHHAMTLLVETSGQAIAIALWDIDRQAITHHVQQLQQQTLVGHVRVQVQASGESFLGGPAPAAGRPPDYHATITPPTGEDVTLGTIDVWADSAHFEQLLWRSQLRILPGYLLFTLLVCTMVTWVVRRDLGRPLQHIADFASTLTPQALSQPLQLQRPQHPHIDEMDCVIQGFTQLQTALDKHIKNLDTLVQARTAELNRVLLDIKHMSETDALSGAFNRHAMSVRLPQEMAHCAQSGRPLSVIFADIDHFKRINDQHGHHVGDLVIQTFVQHLQRQVRSQLDWVVRFGGEEFVVFMPGAPLHIAITTAQRMAECLRSTPIDTHSTVLSITSSFGVVAYQPPEDIHSLLRRADAMLYQAKTEGRDRVCPAPNRLPPW